MIDAARLRCILQVKVDNDQTENAIEAVSHRNAAAASVYPGELFTVPGTNGGGTALVGTLNIAGIGWLLVDHKKQMGVHRRVESVCVWSYTGIGSAEVSVQMLITLDAGAGSTGGTKRPADDSGGSWRAPPPHRPQGGS